MLLPVQHIGELKAQIEQRRLRRSLASLGQAAQQPMAQEAAGGPQEDAQEAHITRIMAQASTGCARHCLATSAIDCATGMRLCMHPAQLVGYGSTVPVAAVACISTDLLDCYHYK